MTDAVSSGGQQHWNPRLTQVTALTSQHGLIRAMNIPARQSSSRQQAKMASRK